MLGSLVPLKGQENEDSAGDEKNCGTSNLPGKPIVSKGSIKNFSYITKHVRILIKTSKKNSLAIGRGKIYF